MSLIKKIGILLVLCWISLAVKGNTDTTSLPEAEATLKLLFSGISPDNADDKNMLMNDSIIRALEKALHLPGSFEYPFEQLRNIGKITSDNQKIRILTWNLPLSNATNQYYGFVMHKTDNGNAARVIKLTDRSSALTDPAMAILNAENWYGCLIYDIIDTRESGETYYTLLGYDPENLFICRKLVDVMWFSNNEPVFGKPLFHLKNLYQNRLLFEYSSRVQMSLKWNDAMKMIVFDHLSPSKPSYTGNYQYYGPDFSYDALKFEKGVWELVENVDVRN